MQVRVPRTAPERATLRCYWRLTVVTRSAKAGGSCREPAKPLLLPMSAGEKKLALLRSCIRMPDLLEGAAAHFAKSHQTCIPQLTRRAFVPTASSGPGASPPARPASTALHHSLTALHHHPSSTWPATHAPPTVHHTITSQSRGWSSPGRHHLSPLAGLAASDRVPRTHPAFGRYSRPSCPSLHRRPRRQRLVVTAVGENRPASLMTD